MPISVQNRLECRQGQSRLIFRCNKATLQSVATVCWDTKGSLIQQGRSASATRAGPGAGAGQPQARVHISCLQWRPGAWRLWELALASVVPTGLRPLCESALNLHTMASHPTSSQRARASPLPSRFLHLAPSQGNDSTEVVRKGPVETITAPCNFLQGEIKNQIWVDNWKFEPCCCNLILSACWKYLKVKSPCLHEQSEVVTASLQRTRRIIEACCYLRRRKF